MSSIDKGVEQVVNRLGRNVRVVKFGSTIYGYMNGEVVFSLADRYGYINDREEQIIRDGIRRYDEEARRRRERQEAERRAREEAIRRAREEAERQRREMLERERRQALSDARAAVSAKRNEAQSAMNKRSRLSEQVNNSATQRRNAIASLSKLSPMLDFSALTRRSAEEERKQRAVVEQEVSKCRQTLQEVEKLSALVTDGKTTEEYQSLAQRCRKITVAPTGDSSVYENGKFLSEISDIQAVVRELSPAIRQLQELQNEEGEVGIIAKESLRSISSLTVGNVSDLTEIATIVESRLSKITESVESGRISEKVGKLSYLQGAISACKKTRELAANSTYTANDYRDEIVQKAYGVLAGFQQLAEQEFTTCSKLRLGQVADRLETILVEGKGENVLAEVEKLGSELTEYTESDKLHVSEYEEYKTIVQKLKDYGVPAEEIEAFDVKNYTQQKRELSARIFQERREFEKSQLIMTDMHVKSIMEEMGYEQFSTIGDAEGYVRESLFTKAGYDGVLWQVITYANGSVTRRVIGVNKGETQTDVAYVKEVAAEMERNNDPQEFITKFQEATGSTIAVTEAVEHDSEDAEEAIKRNGYHVLSGEALELYERKTEKIVQGKPAKRTNTQVRATGKDLVRNSSNALREAVQSCKAMYHAN